MVKIEKEQGIFSSFLTEGKIINAVEAFIIDRKIQNLSPGTLGFYRDKLNLFIKYCDIQEIDEITQIDSGVMRGYLAWLVDTGHNPGGQHAAYRTVRALIRWWIAEFEPENWKDPTKKVKAPKLQIVPLEPVPLETVRLLLNTCDNKVVGLRDRALILFLLDTGVRAAEALAIRVEDIDISGSILVRRGKGGKPRTVFIGSRTKKALRKYLINRNNNSNHLWLTDEGTPLVYWGLRAMIARRSKMAGITPPQIHAFRRAFALAMLRAGTDVYSLQHLLGHADLQTLRRYLNQTNTDLQAAHTRASPGDNL